MRKIIIILIILAVVSTLIGCSTGRGSQKIVLYETHRTFQHRRIRAFRHRHKVRHRQSRSARTYTKYQEPLSAGFRATSPACRHSHLHFQRLSLSKAQCRRRRSNQQPAPLGPSSRPPYPFHCNSPRMDALDYGQHNIRSTHPRAQQIRLALDSRLMQAGC